MFPSGTSANLNLPQSESKTENSANCGISPQNSQTPASLSHPKPAVTSFDSPLGQQSQGRSLRRSSCERTRPRTGGSCGAAAAVTRHGWNPGEALSRPDISLPLAAAAFLKAFPSRQKKISLVCGLLWSSRPPFRWFIQEW